MSTFCVFGIKKSLCVERARKIVPTKIGKTFLSVSQHSVYANLLAEYLFLDEEIKARQIAPAFDTPQFANDWIDLARRGDYARRMKIMVEGPKTDKLGRPMNKNGKPVLTWVEWRT